MLSMPAAPRRWISALSGAGPIRSAASNGVTGTPEIPFNAARMSAMASLLWIVHYPRMKYLFALFFAASCAHAQDFPTRPIAIVAPFPAGSISDVVARLAAERMQKSLGQPVL